MEGEGMTFPAQEEYCIELDQITIDEAIATIAQTINEAKRKFPGKSGALGAINVKKTGRTLERLAVGLPSIELIIVLFASKMAYDAWREIVLPLLKKRLKIEPRRKL